MRIFLSLLLLLIPYGAQAQIAYQNISCYEQEQISATMSSSSTTFTTSAGVTARDLMIANGGTVGAQVLLSATSSPTAVNSASAAGTTQIYVPGGAVIIVNKSGLKYVAGITDSSTATLYLCAGNGG